MSMFPRFTEVSPIFRLMDDYDRAIRRSFRDFDDNFRELRHWSPKFDIQEQKDRYVLHGEFPGIEQKDINIEWTDSNTLTISGRTEHRREQGERPQGFIEGESSGHEYHKPTVEEEGDKSKEAETAVTKAPEQSKEVQKAEDAPRYWVTERSVGSFSRSFNFPTQVEHDGVKANLKNGILTINVPKAKPKEPKRINIES